MNIYSMNIYSLFRHISLSLFYVLILCGVSLLGSGCDSPRTEIIGHWGVDLSVLGQSSELQKISPPARKIARNLKLNMMRDWYFSFDSNQNLEMIWRRFFCLNLSF